MRRSGREILALFLLIASGVYGLGFWSLVTFDPDSAWTRYELLDESGRTARAAWHGSKAIALRLEDGLDGPETQNMQLIVAGAHDRAGDPDEAIRLYRAVLEGPMGEEMRPADEMAIVYRIADLHLTQGRVVEAASLAVRIVEAAGAGHVAHSRVPDAETALYTDYLDRLSTDLRGLLPPNDRRPPIAGETPDLLVAAENMTTLGAYYAARGTPPETAAGLLSTAYDLRASLLGIDHQDTIHSALLLGPVYERMGQVDKAVPLYLDAFHAQERTYGANHPVLSLYIRLLVSAYEEQGRMTEAEALNLHMRNIFSDAFGARRYAANQDRDRTADINRPVSEAFPLPASYKPDDLVAAGAEAIPLSKLPHLDEMKIRMASIDETTSMPASLSALLSQCEQPGEALSLRSGYRSYDTQAQLYRRAGPKGRVTPPGTSEHQLGLAADIDVNGRFMRASDRAYRCFEENAFRYGFILTYPQGNDYLGADDGFEPWHWRFVGPRTALLYREIGPLGKPQEFLAALPCYEERAMSGLFLSVEGRDVCLDTLASETTAQDDKAKGRGETG
ncbi:D-alanyl-D-alanine carboxypeptidase family protein [Parvularcula bermudensis]|uniref:D-alanyl-D-alanine carboxypeptidase family protein n=1 Tax=Parvularcula bermudensis TaxID=208216 RepID=UPI000309EED2|nr:D-alanyl-D-alanine carboxypeptidase family protein [Parvularcula bermudensis]